MSEELPQGWVNTTLGAITAPSRERALPAEVPTLRYVGLEHVQSDTMTLITHGRADAVRSTSLKFLSGDVLYGRMRPYLNKVWVANFDGICSAEFIVFPQYNGLNNEFLAFRLNAEDFVAFANRQSSGERPRVNFEKLSRFSLLLPPTAEQDRIATALKTTLAGIQRAEAAARRALGRIDRYRLAVLKAAVAGDITRGWRQTSQKPGQGHDGGTALLHRILASRRAKWERSELKRMRLAGKEPRNDKWKSRSPIPSLPHVDENLPRLPPGWSWATLGQLGELDRGRSKHRPRDDARLYGGPYPFIQTGDIRRSGGTIREHSQTYSAFGLKQSRLWPTGTLCITIAANIGETALLSYPACFPDSVVGFVQSEDLLNVRYVEFFIRSKQSDMDRDAPATAQKNLSLNRLAALAVPLPPRDEQDEIVGEVQRRLAAADRLAATLSEQLARAKAMREALLREAFSGMLVAQDATESHASELLAHSLAIRARVPSESIRSQPRATVKRRPRSMNAIPSSESFLAEWQRAGAHTDATRLFRESGFSTDQVISFYEVLRATPQVLAAFRATRPQAERSSEPVSRAGSNNDDGATGGRFRLIELWLDNFKNLRDYTIRFDPSQGLDVVLGWNGTGKSNLFEALLVVFRDLHEWWERNRWPDAPLNGFRLRYEIDRHIIEVTWSPGQMKRPLVKRGSLNDGTDDALALKPIKREELPLPRFVFGYYSGPTNRLAEHFLPMKQAHYERLRDATSDDAHTLATLLEQRRFFCAETHHAKYVLLGFSYREDPQISAFLANRLRIVGFESALFIIRKPRWAKSGSKAGDFWGATGIMRRVMERLRRYAIAPMVLEQKVSDGYRTSTEEHYYFFLPDLESLHAFAAEYHDARSFFLALESTDFSELIHDVKIQIRIKSTDDDETSITFHQLSEGEQQLLMVLGLMRFTKSRQSLVLLDEPDTHLNPHWSVEYVKDLIRVMGDGTADSTEQQTSQILIATHDPLVIASLLREQIHLLKRDPDTGICRWAPASVNPRGLGYTGILTSDMFGFRSDLDPETLADLDERVRLVASDQPLTPTERTQLEVVDKRLADVGFAKAFSDPYYAAFVRAWGRRHSELMAGKQFLTQQEVQEIDRIAREVLEESVAEVKAEGER